MKGSIRQIFNRALHLLARYLPGGGSLRPFLHRLRGVRIGGSVFIGDDVYLENEYPECVEIRDRVGIGLRSTLIAHLQGPGKLLIEEDVVLGPGCLVICGRGQSLVIGQGSVIAAGAVIAKSVPPHTLCAGPRAEIIARVTIPWANSDGYAGFVSGLRPIEDLRD